MTIALNELIRNQVFEFIIMFYAGLTMMVLYEFFLWIKSRTKPRRFANFLEDLLFWIFAAFIISAFLYYCSYGRISFHAFVALGSGALLWKKCFYGIIAPDKHTKSG